jgi:hypothetical protein
MEISLYSVRGQWDCSRKAILEVKEPFDGRDISAAHQRADFWHSVALKHLGDACELPPSVPTEYGFPNLLVGRVLGQHVQG